MNVTKNANVIDQLVAERQVLLSRLVKLDNALEANHEDLAEIMRCRLCDDLVDYCSRGHFQAFHLTDHVRGNEIAAALTALNTTTAVCVGFNDRYGDAGSVEHGVLRRRLDELLEVLETRFEIEDDLFAPAPLAELA